MQPTVSLMFGVHAHQPVGNFESVFRKAYSQCYFPFLRTLSEHPGIRSSLHFSGCLLEWIERNEPKFIDQIARLAERGQIEMLSGGFYEPILPVIPRPDALGQIQMMNEYILRRFGQKVRGLWLAERVWEPHLPSILADGGIEFIILDDSHFIYAGLRPDTLFGYYLTEDSGNKVAVFPIDKTLRYYIPFKLPEDTINYLKETSTGSAEKGITYGDDAEKFGIWPDTYKWVYEDKYLERLFSAIEANKDWIKMPMFSEYIDSHPPVERIYLPAASYDEMMEWALPAEAALRFQQMLEKLKAEGRYADFRPFVRGGFWRNFLAKYPEANRMHKKMLHVSRKVNSMKGPQADEAKLELWRGQCNCPYWHGLFGGLYLNYLRYANYHHLLKAENMADKAHEGDNTLVEQFDYDGDGYEELLITNANYSVCISPGYGGSVVEFDYRPKAFNVTDVMARHREAYHEKIAGAQAGSGQMQSIHDLVRVKEKGLESFLYYDWYERLSFLDHFLDPKTVLKDFAASHYQEEGDFIAQPYQLTGRKTCRKNIVFTLKRAGNLLRPPGRVPLVVEKVLAISAEAGIEADYFIRCGSVPAGETLFSVELNLTLLAGEAADRYYEIPGRILDNKRMNSSGIADSISEFRLVDDWMKIMVILEFRPAANAWRFPVETVSQSESGFERTYQGSCILVVWPLTLRANDCFERTIHLRIEDK